MLMTQYASRFKKDLKIMQKRGLDMAKIFEVMTSLENEIPLEPSHREHPLQGEYSGFLECHIEPDWLLIYRIEPLQCELYFARTGSHSDLF